MRCVICVFCLLVVLVRLSVPVQVIDWKDSSPKCVDGDVKPYLLTHSLTIQWKMLSVVLQWFDTVGWPVGRASGL